MAAAGGLAVRDAQRLLDAAVVAVALSLEAFKGSTVPFDPRLHGLRGQPGPTRGRRAAARAARRQPGRGQPRRLRPRAGPVHAALRAAGARRRRRRAGLHRGRAGARARRGHRQPAGFPDDGDILSGGNFHGQPLSLPLDHLALALCELASFSERRSTPSSPRPTRACRRSSRPTRVSSGLMIAQYAAAALVNGCRCSHTPPARGRSRRARARRTSTRWARAALKAPTVRERRPRRRHRARVRLQGLEFHRPLRTTDTLEAALAGVRGLRRSARRGQIAEPASSRPSHPRSTPARVRARELTRLQRRPGTADHNRG